MYLRHVVTALVDVPPASAHRSRSLVVGRILSLHDSCGLVITEVCSFVISICHRYCIRESDKLHAFLFSVECERSLVVPVYAAHVYRLFLDLPHERRKLASGVVARFSVDQSGGRVVDAGIGSHITIIDNIISIRYSRKECLRYCSAKLLEEARLTCLCGYADALRLSVIHKRTIVDPFHRIGINLNGGRSNTPAAVIESRLLVVLGIVFQNYRSLILARVSSCIARIDRGDPLRKACEFDSLWASVIGESGNALPCSF